MKIILREYQDRFGEDFYLKHKEVIDQFIKDGYLSFSKEKDRIYPTYNGMMVLDQLLLETQGGTSTNKTLVFSLQNNKATFDVTSPIIALVIVISRIYLRLLLSVTSLTLTTLITLMK